METNHIGTALASDVLSGVVGTPAPALVENWHAWLRQLTAAGELSAATVATYKAGLNRYLVWCVAASAAAHEQATALAWIAQLRTQGIKPASVNTWLAGVRAFWRWLVDIGVATESPLARLRGQRRSGTSQRHSRATLTAYEVRRVLAAPDTSERGTRDRAILHLLAYNALRRIEVCRADLAHLRTTSDRLVLDVHGKGKRAADDFVVLTHPDTVTSIYDWIAVRGAEPGPLFWSLSRATWRQRLTQRGMNHIVKAYFAQVGIFDPQKTLHSLRHTAITNAITHGAPPHKVQSMARHANLATTMIYYHELDRLTQPAESFVQYDTPE